MNISPTLAPAVAGVNAAGATITQGASAFTTPTTVQVNLSNFSFTGALTVAEQAAIMEQMQAVSEAGVLEAMRTIQDGKKQRW